MGQLNPGTLHYIRGNTFWDVRPSYHNTSNIWRSRLSIRDVLKRYIRSIIGDGSNTNVWSDIWLEEGSLIDGERVIYDSGSSETRDL